MSKRIKGFICALIAGMMVTTSCGITSLAADEDTSADNTASESAEATATPAASDEELYESGEAGAGADIPEDEKDVEETAATEAPADATEAPAESTESPAGDKYADDSDYQVALQVCSALGIIEGYEDGSVQPESTVTRAEMATIILRMLNNTSTSTYANVFADVSSDHWAANNIQTAVEQGIVNGMGDGTFVPDGNVQYEQVMKMLVCALNYGTDAERTGGYPNGYISVASSTLSLLDGVSGTVGTDMPRGEVIKAVANALFAPYRVITEFSGGNPVYAARDCLGVELFKLYEDEGIVTTTPNLTISSSTEARDGMVFIDGVGYRCNMENADDFIGTKVKFYYLDSTSDTPEIIVMAQSGTMTQQEFSADQIDSIDYESGTVQAYASETSSSTRRYNISNATIVYNGTVTSAADYQNSDKYDSSVSYSEFLVPKVGTVRITDYDSDGTYDVVFVDSYETMLVTSATSSRLSGKINDTDTVIDVNNDSNDKTITVTKAGITATVRNLSKNDVASIKRNLDGTLIDIVVTGETITGTIESFGYDDGDMTIVVNGQTYEVDKNAESNVKAGASVVLYLDMFDRVGYIESSSGSMLSSNEKYAVIVNAYREDNGDNVVKLFNQDGETVTLKVSGRTRYWGPKMTEMTTSMSADDIVAQLSSEGSYITCGSNPIKLCKYSVNSNNELTKLYVAVNGNTVTDTDALRIYANSSGSTSLQNVASIGGTVGGNYIQDGITEFSVPDTATERMNEESYSTGEVVSSSYTIYDGGSNAVYAVGDMLNERYPQVLIKFESGSSTLSPVNNFTDTASNGPTFMLSSINEAVDSEGNEVFQLVGYSNGQEVSYTTASNTGVYDYTGWSEDNNREYGGDLIFDATSDDASEFTNAVNLGDIFYVGVGNGAARTLIRLVDIEKAAKIAVTGADASGAAPGYPAFINVPAGNGISSTRDSYYGGFITGVDIQDSAFITLSSYDGTAFGEVAIDASAVLNCVTLNVDSNGNITGVEVEKADGMEPAEIMCFGDDPYEFDYAMFKGYRGTIQVGYVIRFVIDA